MAAILITCFKDGERFEIGELAAEAIYYIGHTPADITFKNRRCHFVGGTLFAPAYERYAAFCPR
jgi:glyoxylase-like metal-dependent hydrolase (beta-lactamase superfamily II)